MAATGRVEAWRTLMTHEHATLRATAAGLLLMAGYGDTRAVQILSDYYLSVDSTERRLAEFVGRMAARSRSAPHDHRYNVLHRSRQFVRYAFEPNAPAYDRLRAKPHLRFQLPAEPPPGQPRPRRGVDPREALQELLAQWRQHPGRRPYELMWRALQVGAAAHEAIPVLKELRQSNAWGISTAASMALARVAPEQLAARCAALREADPVAAVGELAASTAAERRLARQRVLAAETPAERAKVVEILLGNFPPPGAVHDRWRLPLISTWLFGELRTDSAKALAMLEELAKRPDTYGMHASLALLKLEPASPERFDALLTSDIRRRQETHKLRKGAERVMPYTELHLPGTSLFGELRSLGQPIVEGCRRTLAGSDPRRREQSILYLKQLATPAAIELLIETLADPDDTIYQRARDALLAIGPPALAPLEKIARDGAEPLKSLAAELVNTPTYQLCQTLQSSTFREELK